MCNSIHVNCLADEASQPHVSEPAAVAEESAQATPSLPDTTGHAATGSKTSRSTRSAQQDSGTQAVHQFPSPPKARTRGGRRAQTAKEAPVAAAKPSRTRRGVKQQPVVEEAALEEAKPAQSVQAPQTVSDSAETGSAEDKSGAGHPTSAASPHSKDDTPQHVERHTLSDAGAARADDCNSLQHSAAAAEDARSPSASPQMEPPQSLARSGKRKESPNAPSPVTKRPHQELPLAQPAASPQPDVLKQSEAVANDATEQASCMLVDEDTGIDSNRQHTQEDPEIPTEELELQSSDVADDAGLSAADDASMLPESSPVQQAASISDSEADDSAGSQVEANQIQSSPLQPDQAADQRSAHASTSSPVLPAQSAAQQDISPHSIVDVEAPAHDNAADPTEPASVADVDLTAESPHPTSPPAALAIAPAEVDQPTQDVAAIADVEQVASSDKDSMLETASAVALPGTAEAVPAKQGQGAASSTAPEAGPGLGRNLVSAIRSFLPGSKAPEPQLAAGKKPVKVCCLLYVCKAATSSSCHNLAH